ncbi:MAG: F0F1 ATP synthase subunit B', partial [Dongiaceae bacterium]
VWLAITFVALYLLMARVALPGIAAVLENRERRIEDDLDRAGRLKAEADEVLAAYNKALAEARGAAQAEMRKAAAVAAPEAAKRDSAIVAELATKTRAAEARIAVAKTAALVELRAAAAEVAAAAVVKLIGVEPPGDRIRAAVEAAVEGRG